MVTAVSAKSTALTSNQKLAMGAATICFLIGWFHTGQGLANYRVLGTQYGGFILATGLLLIMVLAYNKAIKGSIAGLGFYLLCAVITFVCNLNSFYPNYRADSLIREELRQHRANLGDLRELIKTLFQDPQLDALAESVKSKSAQLQAQCRQRGFGPLTEQALREIEKELNRSITRLRLGSNQSDWDRCAEQYAVIIEQELNAKLKENRYSDKLQDIAHAEEYYMIFGDKIDKTLTDKTELRRVPNYVEELIEGYRDSCKKAVALHEDEKKNLGSRTEQAYQPVDCDLNYTSPNIGLGTFSHTFKSVWATINDGGTWAVVIISLFIDFLMPLALYLLVRSDAEDHESKNFWNVGGNHVGPSSQS